MACGFKAFIDESGSEGGKHGQGASEWFALSAIVMKEYVNTADMFNEYNHVLKEQDDYRFQKYQRLNAKCKIVATRIVGQQPHTRVAHVLVHKPSLTDQKLRQDQTRLYKYVARFLLERVSWICRDAAHPPKDPLCQVTLSERRGFPYSEVLEYLSKLRNDSRCRIAWPHLHESVVSTESHYKSDGCRLADIVASSITQAIEYTDQQITDDRPIKNLAAITYRAAKGAQLRGNGIKVFPQEAEQLLDNDPRFAWLRGHYPP